MATPSIGSLPTSERIATLDIIHGFALLEASYDTSSRRDARSATWAIPAGALPMPRTE